MGARTFLVPYDSGHRGWRMGAGPLRLLARGDLPGAAPVAVEAASRLEIAAAFELARGLASEVLEAAAAGQGALVLSGNCGVAALGVTSGVWAEDLGVVWFDAHGESETPETTRSGYLDGMGLSILTGRCWQGPMSLTPPLRTLPAGRILLAGARDLSDAERRSHAESGMLLAPGAQVRGGGWDAALARLAEAGVGRVYLHLDLDVLDPDAVAPANTFAAPGGLTGGELLGAIDAVLARFPLAGAALASWDPSVDREGRVEGVAVAALRRLHAAL
jgi:arginase